MHLVCRCSLPVWRRSFLKKGTPRDLFWPHPGSAPGRIWPKNNNTCKGPWVLHPYQVSSKSIKRFWRRSRKCEKFTDGRRTTTTTDGRTDDGRCAMIIAHSSLRLRWAKNNKLKSISVMVHWSAKSRSRSQNIVLVGKNSSMPTNLQSKAYMWLMVWKTELQITFQCNAYIPPNFLINADFQNLKLYFHPLYFSQCVKEKLLQFWSAYLYFCVVLNINLVVIS